MMRFGEEANAAATKLYVGLVWIGDQPGIRVSVPARSSGEALASVEAKYGTGHVVSLWHEEDASRPRSA